MTTYPSSNLWTAAALVLVAALPEASPLQAQEEQQRQQAEPTQQRSGKHIVRPGDTLWDLARFYLEDAFLWPEIYRLNTLVIEDPHWIYPGEQLSLEPGEPGEPGEEVEIPTTVAVQTPEEAAMQPGEEEIPGEPIPEAETLLPPVAPEPPQVSPGARTIFAAREVTRQTLVYQPTEPIPAEAVSPGDFRRSGMLLSLDELGPRGEVIEFISPLAAGVKGPGTVPRFGRVYVTHPGSEAPELGARLLLFRVERRIRPYGFVIRPTGVATVAAVHDDVSTVVVTEVFERVLVGDQVAFVEPFDLQPGVFAEPVESGPTGELVAFMESQYMASVDDIVFVDVGRTEGIVVGDEFDIYLAARQSPHRVGLPEEHIASGRVVRVTERTATVRLIEQRHAAIEIGLPVRLVRKMPL